MEASSEVPFPFGHAGESGATTIEVAPRPAVDEALAAKLASELFGVTGEVKELGSHQDRNFLIRSADGPRVLKIANRGWGRAALEAQDAALLHIAATRASSSEGASASGGEHHALIAPEPVPSLDGSYIREAKIGDDVLLVRMLTFVEGTPLSGTGYIAPIVVADLGYLAGRAAAVLSNFNHPGLDRVGQWDMRHAATVVMSLLPSIKDEKGRTLVAEAVSKTMARVDTVASKLRLQAIHSDVTDDNVVGKRDEEGRNRPFGVIDFGDLSRSWIAAEVAITCSSVLRHRSDDPLSVLPAIRAFHHEMPLTEEEVVALWPLILLRGATLVAAGEHQASLDPDNESVTGPLASEWNIFHCARSLPFDVAEAAIRDALGMSPNPKYAEAKAALAAAAPLLPSVTDLVVIDLSSTSDVLHSGMHLEGQAAEIRVLKAAAGSGGAATRWGEARMSRTIIDSPVIPKTVALGVDLAVPAGTGIAAPFPVTITKVSGEGVVLSGPAGLLLILEGVSGIPAEGSTVTTGSLLGSVSSGGLLHVRTCVEPSLDVPPFVVPSMRGGWTQLAVDPSPLFRKDLAAPKDDADRLLERRDKTFARVQEHYFKQPMRMERGWMHHLIDTDGRSYLDMVNNVAAIGHSHPRLVDAVTKQMRLLNTNSRFHYGAIADISERLTSLAPEGLDTVFLVNSGSEAVDLALRMAQVVTGRLDILAVKEAYHGWTLLSDAVTTSLWDNPKALETRPDWIHLASAPNSYRGKYRGEAAATGYTEEMQGMVKDLVAKGRPPAAFISEPVFGNAGGVMLPKGYLAATYEAVRAAGGLCIADEVQVGYGRLGHYWWAHEMHGVVPDMITIAKAMGNGYPLGAVITKKSIADAFSAQGSFFSSAGGSPVSCMVGLTVLDVIRDDGLQANAAKVGDFLIERCNQLKEKYPMVGAIHGMGLYMGIELVRDRETLDPATKEAYALCDRLRELGVICQPTGERANVLKMKPPMCLTLESADFFVNQVETALRDGW